MSDDVVIRAEGLGKKYVIGHQAGREGYVALRDVMARNAKNLARSLRDLASGRQMVGGDAVEEFWALRNLDFEIKRGEVVGIIGRNGAGKSTLLKILSRITEPSEGRVTIKGRVASLLEVGTGFHPELTGRENIYLNGAILGMSRAEIKSKFDEIVDFAGVEKFLDTPVKRYSSGMYVRLAFAVAAHLEPEILVVDEVLAVGDAEFQRKCLGKMQDVAGHGRTVLFVSHNMAAVQQLCPQSILLSGGRQAGVGATDQMIAQYLYQRQDAGPSTVARAVGESLRLDGASINPLTLRTGEAAKVVVEFSASDSGQMQECTLNIYTVLGVKIAIVDPRASGAAPFRYKAGRFTVEFDIEAVPFIDGEYTIGLWIVTHEYTGFVGEVAEFVIPPSSDTLGFTPYPAEVRGYVELAARSMMRARIRPAEKVR